VLANRQGHVDSRRSRRPTTTLVPAAGWRSVFLLVAAISVPAWWSVTWAPQSRNPDPPALDLAGLITFTAGLTCLSFAFVGATTAGWTAPGTLLLIAAAVALVALFAAVEVRLGDRAMFDVRLFGRPEFVAVVCQPFTVTLGFVILIHDIVRRGIRDGEIRTDDVAVELLTSCIRDLLWVPRDVAGQLRPRAALHSRATLLRGAATAAGRAPSPH
jgi:hypothetical protein